jgi:hypothetical protein
MREDKVLSVSGLWGEAKVKVEVGLGKVLRVRAGGLRFLVIR